MRIMSGLGRLVSKIRVAPSQSSEASGVEPTPSACGLRKTRRAADAQVAPTPLLRPELAAEMSTFMQIEHQVLERFRPQMRQALEALCKYYTDHAARMRYDEYIRLGYGIGSGAIESAHKQLVHARLRQAGMRWSELGARRLLALRILLLNGNWTTVNQLRMARIAA